MLKVRFRLGDHAGNSFEAITEIRNPLLWWREIACDQQIKAVGEALHVNQGIPLRVLQLFTSEYFIIDVLLEDPKIDIVRTGEL